MVKYSTLALSVACMTNAAVSTTAATLARLESPLRRLSYEKFGAAAGGYEPSSQVTDHAAVDLDQLAIVSQMGILSDATFAASKEVYQQGGNSKSYANVTLKTPLTVAIAKGTPIKGVAASGAAVNGKAYQDYPVGTTELRVQYLTSDIQSEHVGCRVGGLPVGTEDLTGCLVDDGAISIDGAGDYGYGYVAAEDNRNGRTIQGFSTAAEKKMYNGCLGCPYDEYKAFYDYYGEFDYANKWVLAALDGGKTNFKNGNADFSKYGLTGRGQAVMKGTAYMNVYMYVIREFYDALDDCQSGCTDCNDDPVVAWDEGVAFYTGSTGKALLYALADKRSQNYRTGGPNGGEMSGTSKINYDLFREFNQGQYNILSGACDAAARNVDRIIALMSVPLVQGTLRYAYKVGELDGGEKEHSEGSVFAAAVLPKVAKCSPEAAQTVYDNMSVGSTSTNFADVKAAFESVYQCMGITCADVGGLIDTGTKEYYKDFTPCRDQNVASSEQFQSSASPMAVGLGIAAAVLAAAALAFIYILVKREKSGKPMFAESSGQVS